MTYLLSTRSGDNITACTLTVINSEALVPSWETDGSLSFEMAVVVNGETNVCEWHDPEDGGPKFVRSYFEDLNVGIAVCMPCMDHFLEIDAVKLEWS
jgi:hypothetical protein